MFAGSRASCENESERGELARSEKKAFSSPGNSFQRLIYLRFHCLRGYTNVSLNENPSKCKYLRIFTFHDSKMLLVYYTKFGAKRVA